MGRAVLLAVVLAAGTFGGPAPRAAAEDSAPAPRGPADPLRARLAELARSADLGPLLRAADDGIARDPRALSGWEFRAFALHRLGRTDAARAAYERLLALDPDHVWGRTQLGGLLVASGEPREALPHLRRALVLDPCSDDARRKLVRAHAEAGDHTEAVLALTAALEAGAAPGPTRAELGYHAWAAGDLAASREHWERAAAAGADPEACAHGLRLVEWDERLAERHGLRTLAERRREGPEWVVRVGEAEVLTRVGPELPAWFERLVESRLERARRVFGGGPGARLRVRLARTFEEHERSRRALFPQGGPGRSFFLTANGGRPGSGPVHEVHVAWSGARLERSVSHELTHAVLRAAGPLVPAWFDEGAATWLETEDLEADRPELADALAAAPGLTLAGLLETGPADFRGTGARARYAQAWSVVRFLAGRPGGADRLRAFLAESGRSRDPYAAFCAVWGEDLAALDAEWRASLGPVGGPR